MDLLHYFSDPVLRAPTIGCMLMGFAASLVGMLMLLKRQALIGEVLSHAAFPGIVAGALVASFFPWETGDLSQILVMASAALACLAGSWAVSFLKVRMRIRSDSALCFVLAVFFGVGVLLASQIQMTHAVLYKQSLLFLYGQVATMTDAMIPIYALLAFFTLAIVIILYYPLQALLFDRQFATINGLRTTLVDTCVSALLILAIVVGMRSIGVVLMAGMLIAPAIAARPWTHRLWACFVLAAVFGVVSSFLGNVVSVEGSRLLAEKYPEWKFSLPTGPLILLFAAAFALLSLFFAPKSGILARIIRMALFRQRIAREHLLKALWRKGRNSLISQEEAAEMLSQSLLIRWFCLLWLSWEGLLTKEAGGLYCLTDKGWARACRIVRLHRLWEVYLVDYLSQGVDKVHRSAEELEHVMSAELETELEKLLGDLRFDPHSQPIPSREEATWPTR